jgi:homoserine dehydrogenase
VNRPRLRVGVLGAGTVGAEVVRGLPSLGDGFDLAAVAVRNVDAARDRGLPVDVLTDAPAHLVADPDIDVVVELMGGDEPARTLVLAALRAGKPVVTANKHLIAHHGAELEATARRTGAAFRFEASVGGGIPVLSPLAADLAANRIDSVRGIVNGTTNFILTAMAAGEGTYEAVLRDAQQRGYAEADPSGDVEGRDAVNKLVILARLAFGAWLEPSCVGDRPATAADLGAPGITGVTAAELEAAAELGLAIRLLASATRDGGDAAGEAAIRARVIPTAVPRDSAFGRTDGVRNRIEVRGDRVGVVGFDGPGAGGAATSSAVLGDLAAIAAGRGSTWAELPQTVAAAAAQSAADDETVSRRWFALLPGVTTRDVERVGDLVDGVAQVRGGIGVRTTWTALETLRGVVVRELPDQRSVPWYPIDD